MFKIEGLKVTSRTTVMSYKGSNKSVVEIASELGVANILQGSERKDGERVKIGVQLIDPIGDQHLWAENYEMELIDIFAIQSEIAQEVASYLKAEINPEVKRRMELSMTQNTEALDLYLKAKKLLISIPFFIVFKIS